MSCTNVCPAILSFQRLWFQVGVCNIARENGPEDMLFLIPAPKKGFRGGGGPPLLLWPLFLRPSVLKVMQSKIVSVAEEEKNAKYMNKTINCRCFDDE